MRKVWLVHYFLGRLMRLRLKQQKYVLLKLPWKCILAWDGM
ncbi:hypothetical protein Gotur_002810 [Gossypium turneri]